MLASARRAASLEKEEIFVIYLGYAWDCLAIPVVSLTRKEQIKPRRSTWAPNVRIERGFIDRSIFWNNTFYKV